MACWYKCSMLNSYFAMGLLPVVLDCEKQAQIMKVRLNMSGIFFLYLDVFSNVQHTKVTIFNKLLGFSSQSRNFKWHKSSRIAHPLLKI